MKGGYQILDLKGLKIVTNGVTVKGAYKTIESTNKPILVTGINKNGTELKDRFVAFDSVSSKWEGKVQIGFKLQIDANDLVKIVAI